MSGSLSQMLEALPHTTAEERSAIRAQALRQLRVCNQAAGRAAGELIKAINAVDARQG